MATRLVEKEHLSAKGLIEKAKNVFKKVKEPFKGSQGKEKEISITDGVKIVQTGTILRESFRL